MHLMKKQSVLTTECDGYDLNESVVSLDPNAHYDVARTAAKKVRYCSTDRQRQIRTVACGSATGQVNPPSIILEAKDINHAWKKWRIAKSWLSDHFLRHAEHEQPTGLVKICFSSKPHFGFSKLWGLSAIQGSCI